MRWSLPIGKIRGISIRVHFTFFLLLLWVGVMEGADGGWGGSGRSVFFTVMVFACVLLHELGHSYLSQRFGVRVRSITLLPIGGIAALEGAPGPRQEVPIALAGPAVNFAIAGLVLAFLGSSRSDWLFLHPTINTEDFWPSLLWANLYLGLFNLIPAYPMDGGRVLRGWLARKMDYVTATRRAVGIGQFFSFVMMALGLLVNLWLLLIGIFLYLGASAEERTTVFQAALEKIWLGDVMLTDYRCLGPSEPLSRALDYALHSLQDDFPVVADGRVVGVLTKPALLAAVQRKGLDWPVSQVMSERFEIVRPEESLAVALARLRESKLSMLPVMNDGRLVGIVTLQSIVRNVAMLTERGQHGLDSLRYG